MGYIHSAPRTDTCCVAPLLPSLRLFCSRTSCHLGRERGTRTEHCNHQLLLLLCPSFLIALL
ncbi:hypothetical protein LINGRAHAP2_LOCUS14058, partial [Linum grandiflorum]